MADGRPDLDVDALVERVAARVQQEMQLSAVPPNPAVRGTWDDNTRLKHLLENGAVRVGTDGTAPESAAAVARLIDHTLLKPTATRAQIVKVCEEARRFGFASVCVNSNWIGLTARLLDGSRTMPICVVGFPLGAMSTRAKALETREAIADGAQEIDMVIDIGSLKGGEHSRVYDDIRAVVVAAQGRPVKVILETAMLNREEKVVGCTLAKAAGAAFVKTSTGFGGGGATVEDVALMRAVVGPDLGVKASGGVRTVEDVRRMVAAGATRLGASASVAIVTGGTGTGSY
jgi:deoxyribose-phosphate aldolase